MAEPSFSHSIKIMTALLAAIFLFGLGIVFVLPPFEGPDETAHYSRLKEEAFPQPAGLHGSTHRIASEVAGYAHLGPMPYGWIQFGILHQFDPDKNYTNYHDFFDRPEQVKKYIVQYQLTPVLDDYAPTPETDWEYQHPPLYYAMMSPVLKGMSDQPLLNVMLVVRALSWLMAFVGFAIGVWSTCVYLLSKGIQSADAVTAAGLLYPFLMPEFFWEFTRIGNDSLCLLIFGSIWVCLLWYLRDPKSEAWIYLGLCMGAGWLTKALLIPVSFGIILLLAGNHIVAARKKIGISLAWAPLLKISLLMFLIGSPFYVLSYLHHSVVGTSEFQDIVARGNVVTTIMHSLSWDGVMAGVKQMAFTAIWIFGSWSAIVIDVRIYYIALYAFTFLVAVSYFLKLRRFDILLWTPIWVIGPVVMGLLAHIVATLVIRVTYTPGSYLHILAPAFALIYGVGLVGLMIRKSTRVAISLFCGFIVLSNFVIAFSHMAVFSGCAVPTLRSASFLKTLFWIQPSDVAGCMSQWGMVTDRLSIVAWPHCAYMAFAGAFVLLGYAAIKMLRFPNDQKA